MINAAVTGGDETTVTFHADHCDAGRINSPLSDSKQIRVAAVRLRDFLSEPCDLLKIDIEGAEVDVLNDCAGFLGNVAKVFVEFHSFVGQPQRLESVVQVLAGAGFRLFIKAGMAPVRPFLAQPDFLGMDSQLDIWGVRG